MSHRTSKDYFHPNPPPPFSSRMQTVSNHQSLGSKLCKKAPIQPLPPAGLLDVTQRGGKLPVSPKNLLALPAFPL